MYTKSCSNNLKRRAKMTGQNQGEIKIVGEMEMVHCQKSNQNSEIYHEM